MSAPILNPLAINLDSGGISLRLSPPEFAQSLALLRAEWMRLGIKEYIECNALGTPATPSIHLRLSNELARQWMPDFDTLNLATTLHFDVLHQDDDLLREIWLTLLHSPLLIEFPSAEELMAAVRMRHSIVCNSRRTCLNFHTSEIERPSDCWRYSEETGFVLTAGSPLISSLRKACQPKLTGQLYSFSCSRATEYVILLAIAQEAQSNNPPLLRELQAQWETQAVQAGRFRQAFVQEYGSVEQPLPIHYYVPGDRVWFRNPDAPSFDAKGYEGSWVFYLGGGLFTNFWKRDQPFTLLQKCIEIYHWRDSTWLDAEGELQMDEGEVERRVAQTLADPEACTRIFARVHRLRDAQGIFGEGGCMDATREAPRWVLAPHCDMIEQMNDWP